MQLVSVVVVVVVVSDQSLPVSTPPVLLRPAFCTVKIWSYAAQAKGSILNIVPSSAFSSSESAAAIIIASLN